MTYIQYIRRFAWYILSCLLAFIIIIVYIKNSSQIVAPEKNSTQVKKIEKESTWNILLTWSWYYHENTYSGERTFMLSGDHRNFAVSFVLKDQSTILAECKENLKNTDPWTMFCTKEWDYENLVRLFEVIDSENKDSEWLIENLKFLYGKRVRQAKSIEPGRVIFLVGSPQDSATISIILLSKINNNTYLEITAIPLLICEKNITCKIKIPTPKEDTALDPYWRFQWEWMDSWEFSDPTIKDTYSLIYDIEKHWKDHINTTLNW